MKRRRDTKKFVKKIEKSKDLKLDKHKNNNEVDLWKEIRSNLKPLIKAYNKFSDKRKIAKQKKEEKTIKEKNKQRKKEKEILRLQEQEVTRLKKEKKIKEEKARILNEEKEKKLAEQKIIDDRNEQIRKELIYKERLIKADEERAKQLKRVDELNKLREEERKAGAERNLENDNTPAKKQATNEEDKILKEEELKIKEEELRIKEKEIKLKNEEQRLIEKEQKLKEKEKILNADEKINLKEKINLDPGENQIKKRLIGKVLWFDPVKGYGFIKREDDKKDVHVQLTALQNSGLSNLKKDEQLTFDLEHSNKGFSAVNLEKITDDFSESHLRVIK